MQSVERRSRLLERLFVQGDVTEDDVEDAVLRAFLLDLPVSEIFAFLREMKPCLLPVAAANIPQFSKYDDMDRALNVIAYCGQSQISYLDLGKYLCAKGTKDGACTKYGENHGKLAQQHGFAYFRGRGLAATYLGTCYLHLEETARRRVRARMCLRIPIVQQTLLAAEHGTVYMTDVLAQYLASSTGQGRRPYVTGIFDALRQVADASVKELLNQVGW